MGNILPWLIATLFFMYQYILRVLPNIVVDDIMTKFDISSAVLGQVSGLYYVAYTLLHIPVGMILDRVGARTVIFVAALLVVIGMLPLVYTSSVELLIVGKFILGGASSVGILGLLKIIRDLFAQENFSFVLGISVSAALVGAMYGGQPLNYCIHTFGWYSTFSMLLIAGLAIAISAYVFIPAGEKKSSENAAVKTLSELFSFKKWLVISLIGGLMIGPMEGFADNWATKFFAVVYPSIAPSMAAFLPSLILLGVAVGSPIIGLIVARFNNYYSMLTFCGGVMLLGFQLLFYAQLPLNLLSIVLFAIGMACCYQTLVIHLASCMVPKNCAGTAAACANMIMMAFGYFFHSTISIVIGGGITDPDRIIAGLSVITYCLAIAVLALPLFWRFCAKNKNPLLD
ncbi:MFS transporter [Neorickettsia risticii]|uniref:Lysosomal dipeptide transporter MFSD1 n=1 Tax=Neorickettsia risticii (strain Illinois) TaxID=434131 RepID=C6V5W5_NEORI|nr:MFS transporter [Neorickettsia risticii]ACT69780.1 major facilitator family transporter [Neorickettsia risticii str. Illinois]